MKNIVRIVLVLAFCALPAAAQNNWDWSNSGNTGVVDEVTANFGSFEFDLSSFHLKSNSVGTIDARYPVTNTVGSQTDLTPPWTTLQINVTDQWTASSVTATLYEVDKCSGTQTQICQVVSTDTDQDTHCNTCTFSSSTFDFANNAYYVHVTIFKDTTSEDPRLWALAIY